MKINKNVLEVLKVILFPLIALALAIAFIYQLIKETSEFALEAIKKILKDEK